MGDTFGYDIQQADNHYGDCLTVHSSANNRDYPILVFTPSDSGPSTKECFPVVYKLHGKNDQDISEDGLRSMHHPASGCQEAADFFQVIIVCVIVGNYWYLDAPKDPSVRIATFIGEELPAFVDATLPSIADREHRFLCGFSMGGGGSIRLLCHYPDTFSVALSHGGALDFTTNVTDLHWDHCDPTLTPLLGDYWGTDSKNYHLNSAFNLINHIRDRDDVAIVLEIGRDDSLYTCNKKFHDFLDGLAFKHIYAEYPEGHQWSRAHLFSLLSHLQFFKATC